MAFKVFISHSVGPRELAIVYAFAEEAAKRGISPVIPDRMWQPQHDVPVPQRISQAIGECDVMVLFGTQFGQHKEWLWHEAVEGGRQGKQMLYIYEPEGVVREPTSAPSVKIDRSNLTSTIIEAAQQLEKLKLAKEQKDALTWLVVGGLLFMLFWEKK